MPSEKTGGGLFLFMEVLVSKCPIGCHSGNGFSRKPVLCFRSIGKSRFPTLATFLVLLGVVTNLPTVQCTAVHYGTSIPSPFIISHPQVQVATFAFLSSE